MKHGFSLVELSIVLVILGLLTGGILAGQSLIRAAELRAVSTDIQRYQSAVMTFRDKYFALPGDMRNATAFWGTDASGCPAGGGVGTCNGDGNGYVGVWPFASNTERYRFWQHLMFAGLIEGTYTGVQGTPTPTVNGTSDVIGENVPQSKFDNLGYVIWGRGDSAGTYSLKPGNRLMMGQVSSGQVGARTIRAQEMWNLDKKMDDGRPDQGVMQTNPSYWGGCATSLTAPAEYDLDSTLTNCDFNVHMGF